MSELRDWLRGNGLARRAFAAARDIAKQEGGRRAEASLSGLDGVRR